MPKRPKRPRDPMQLAKFVGDIATGEASDPEPKPETPVIAARRKGGQKGGRVRARKLSAEKRKEIARRAARARWRSTKD